MKKILIIALIAISYLSATKVYHVHSQYASSFVKIDGYLIPISNISSAHINIEKQCVITLANPLPKGSSHGRSTFIGEKRVCDFLYDYLTVAKPKK